MKYIAGFILVVLCFPLGQVAHKFIVLPYSVSKLDQLRKFEDKANKVEVKVRGADGMMSIFVDLRKLKEDQLPEKVTLSKRAEVKTKDGDSINLEPGTTVLVKGLDGIYLLIGAMAGPLEGRVLALSTDLPKQVAIAKAALLTGVPIPPAPEPTPPTPEPTPPTPEPTPPTPEPTPPTPEPTPVATNLSAEQIEALMQTSIKAGEVKEFAIGDVKGWKAGEEEEVDGVTYQTGLAAYQADTIFGPKQVQAKALIKDGKIVKWVYAMTGMEIR